MRKSIELRENRAKHIADARAIFDAADREDRSLTKKEETQYDALEAEIREIDQYIDRLERLEGRERMLVEPIPGQRPPRNTPDGQRDGGEIRSLSPGEVRVLAPNQRISDCPELRGKLPDGICDDELSLGRVVRAIVTGDWRHAQAEQRAMGVGSDSGGGFLLPDPMSSRIIDLARNKAQVFAAGALTVPMESNTLKMAKVTGDLTAVWKAEGAAGTNSTMTLGAVTLSAKTLYVQTRVSLELIEDAQNVEQVVHDAISDSMALKLDLAALRGEGPPIAPLGIRNTAGIQTIDQGANGSAITNFDELSQAWQKVLEANGPDRGLAAIYAPRTAGTMDRFVDGDGQPQTPPLSVQNMKRLVTNQIPINLTKGSSNDATDIYAGDFSQVMVGIRTQIKIEASRTASSGQESAFDNLELWIRAYLRADVALAKADHIVLIDGVIP